MSTRAAPDGAQAAERAFERRRARSQASLSQLGLGPELNDAPAAFSSPRAPLVSAVEGVLAYGGDAPRTFRATRAVPWRDVASAGWTST